VVRRCCSRPRIWCFSSVWCAVVRLVCCRPPSRTPSTTASQGSSTRLQSGAPLIAAVHATWGSESEGRLDHWAYRSPPRRWPCGTTLRRVDPLWAETRTSLCLGRKAGFANPRRPGQRFYRPNRRLPAGPLPSPPDPDHRQ
jgi:hypothetical protein